MDKKKKDDILRRAQAVFFKALLAGYAGNGKKDPRLTTTTSMFGFEKTNTYRYGDFTVIDRWVTSDHSTASSGTTIILFKEVPIWVMTYSGSYPENVISFLKDALFARYKHGIFTGGRGPVYFPSIPQKLIYQNLLRDGKGEFSQFYGREEIIDQTTGDILGFHEYSGGSML